MAFKLLLSPGAETDLAAAYRWYRQRNPAAAARFRETIRATLHDIAEAPRRWALWRDPDTRRRLVSDFPYIIVYDLIDDTILVLTIRHQHQGPDPRFPEDDEP